MKRIQFWQRNLSQITTVILTAAIEKENKSEQLQIQLAYEDIINKFNEVIFLMVRQAPVEGSETTQSGRKSTL